MADTTQPTGNNKKFYMIMAMVMTGLFLMLFVPCGVAMCIVRWREKRQERRDALARQLEEGGEDDILGRPYTPVDDIVVSGYSVYHVEELGEASGWRQSQQQAGQELDSSATQLVPEEQDISAQPQYQHEGQQQVEIAELQHDNGNDNGKGKTPDYPQPVAVEDVPEFCQAKTAGRFHEHLPEAYEQFHEVGEGAEPEFQDAPEVVPTADDEQQQ